MFQGTATDPCKVRVAGSIPVGSTKLVMSKDNLLIECACGSTIFGFTKFEAIRDEDGVVYLSTYLNEFYNKQDSIFSTLWSRMKLAWYALWGKEYHLHELIITGKTDLEKLSEFFDQAAKESKFDG